MGKSSNKTCILSPQEPPIFNPILIVFPAVPLIGIKLTSLANPSPLVDQSVPLFQVSSSSTVIVTDE